MNRRNAVAEGLHFKLAAVPSPVDDRDYIAETIYADGDIPKKFSLVSKLQPIRNQGAESTCAAHTAACIKECQENKDVNLDEYMSQYFVYSNRSNQGSDGMYGRDVMKILNKLGCCTYSEYKKHMNGKKIVSPEELTDKVKEKALKYKIKGYAKINTIDGAKKSLMKDGPCYIAFPVFNYGVRFWKPKQGEKQNGGHAVTMVGWDEKGFIIRNSWGTHWGDGGYCNYPYEDFGSHWDIWTTIDDESGNPLPKPRRNDKITTDDIERCCSSCSVM